MRTRPEALLFLLFAGCATDKIVVPNPPSATVAFASGTLTAEIASTNTTRETGLMNRRSLGSNAGMLFVFSTDQSPVLAGFWMKGTSIPLSIAFIDANQRVITLQDMTPFDTVNIHRSGVPYRYALEVNQGWFAAHTVSAGAVATFAIPPGTVISP